MRSTPSSAKVQQGVAQVIDELPDVVNRLLHWEFRSGFTGRTVEERFSGTFAEGQKVTVRVHCEDGPVRFAPSEDEGYHVRVVNQVRADDDAHAKALSLETVDWRETENGFELTLKNHPKVRSQVHVALPLGPAYIVDVTSDDGSIVWEKLPAEEVRLTTQDGAVKVSDVKAERLEARTEDGAVWLHKVEANEVRALSADGAVRFRGFARRLRCATDDGAVRAALIAPRLARSRRRRTALGAELAGRGGIPLGADPGRLRLPLAPDRRRRQRIRIPCRVSIRPRAEQTALRGTRRVLRRRGFERL